MAGAKLFVPNASRPWLRLTMNSTQSINNNADAKFSFDTVSASGGGWTPLPNAPVTDITLPFAGLVAFFLHDLDWGDAGNGAGYRQIKHRINDVAGSVRAGSIVAPTLAAANTPTVQSYARCRPYAASDTIQFYGKQTSGGALNTAICDLLIIYMDLGSFSVAGTN